MGKGDPAPYDGVLFTYHEYNKILKDKKLFNWVNKQIKLLIKQ